MLVNLLLRNKSIFYVGCAVQMFCFFYFGCAGCFILTAMSYDRYVSICNPLYYTNIMRRSFCVKLVGGVWLSGVLVSLLQAAWIFSLPFCGMKKINYFFCDAPPILKLICDDTSFFEIQALVCTLVFLMLPFVLTLISCTRIIIITSPSAVGRKKAFSTCSSHLIVVILFYGMITPMLNPIVYAQRNHEVKGEFEDIKAYPRLYHLFRDLSKIAWS
uniref:Olfactory receptor n=1 Tax=Laticauda laticaudata TaxID=8630 RepID=A0A8C5RH72_LATLA